MEMILRITAICIIAAILTLVVKRGSGEVAMLISLAAVTVVLLGAAKEMKALISFLHDLGEKSGIPEKLFVPLYKTLGIALVVRAGCALCRDAGETALAVVLESAGAVCAVLVALPLLQEVMELLMEFAA